MKKIKIISCMTTLGIMILIFYFSSQNAADSSEISRGVTKKVVDIVVSVSHLSEEAKQPMAETIHGFIRKTAHFTLYAALGISSFISAKLLIRKKKAMIFAIAVGFCMLYAVSDEIHQLSSLGRSGEMRDVLIDTAGAVTGILFLLTDTVIIKHMINKRRRMV